MFLFHIKLSSDMQSESVEHLVSQENIWDRKH